MAATGSNGAKRRSGRGSAGRSEQRPASASRNGKKQSGKSADSADTKREIIGVVLILVGIILGIFCYAPRSSQGVIAAIVPLLFGIFGIGMYAVPVLCAALGVCVIAIRKDNSRTGTIVCAAAAAFALLSFIHLAEYAKLIPAMNFGETVSHAWSAGSRLRSGGGFFGGSLAYLFAKLFGVTGGCVALAGIDIIMLLVITGLSLRKTGKKLAESVAEAHAVSRARRQTELYNEKLDDTKPERGRKKQSSSNEPQFDEDGFLVHSGKPLTAGDSDYGAESGEQVSSLAKRSKARKRQEAEMSARSENVNAADIADESAGTSDFTARRTPQKRRPFGTAKNNDELEFFPVSGPLKTTKPQKHRRSGKRELKTSNFVPSDVDVDNGSREDFPSYGDEHIDIPMNLSYADVERDEEGFAPPTADDDMPFEPDYSNESSDSAVSAAEEPFDSPAAGDSTEADDDFLRGIPVTRMEDIPPQSITEQSETAQSGFSAERKSTPVGGNDSSQGGSPSGNTVSSVVPAAVIEYQRPPYSLLRLPDPAAAVASESPTEKAKVLIETLNSFNISARIVNISVGPVITRFELQPAQGIRVNRITTLSNDIALALAAPRVRIEAPIPGKSAIGIEIPNKDTAPVYLRDVLETREFNTAKSPLTMGLGKDIAGKVVLADLEKMPHMLIAGQTGSGKSVCINCIILSLIFKSAPKDVRMILIDPKVVELSIFSALPHLFCPVVTEPKKAAGALRWAVTEMEQRYGKMGKVNARDIYRYNAMQEREEDKWPRLVIIIDELADLMMVASKDVEESICRIAQLGRACGIHLIVATQRPSVDVITGLIKANIPSRIAFAVSNGTDSRVIMDASGAEKLLGKGDMLFHANGASKPTRAQGAFVSDEEVEAIRDFFLQNQVAAPSYDESVLSEITGGGGGLGQGNGKQDDDLLPDAVRLVVESGTASISMIQRRLRVGYARAARLVDIMEQNKFVSEPDGAKPRKVLIDAAEYNRIFGGNLQSGSPGSGKDTD